MEIISAVFSGPMISEEFGKLYVIDPIFSIDCS